MIAVDYEEEVDTWIKVIGESLQDHNWDSETSQLTVAAAYAPKGGGSFFASCERDEHGRCLPGTATSAGPTHPEARIKGAIPQPKPWQDPPPPIGVKGGGKPTRPEGEESNTFVGDLGEALAGQLGFRDILPEGKRSFTAAQRKKMGSSIDLEFDHSGKTYELKTCNVTGTEYRLKSKLSEKEDKVKYAKKIQAEVWTLIGVHDAGKREIHFYGAKKPGLTGAEVKEKNFHYYGKVKY